MITCGFRGVNVSSNFSSKHGDAKISPTPSPSNKPLVAIPTLETSGTPISGKSVIELLKNKIRLKEKAANLKSLVLSSDDKNGFEIRLWSGFGIGGIKGLVVVALDRNRFVCVIDHGNHKLLIRRFDDAQAAGLRNMFTKSAILSTPAVSAIGDYQPNPDGEFLLVEGVVGRDYFLKVFSLGVNADREDSPMFAGQDLCEQITEYLKVEFQCKLSQPE